MPESINDKDTLLKLINILSSFTNPTIDNITEKLSKDYVLTTDIDLSDTPICSIGYRPDINIPENTTFQGFTGTFDGQGHHIIISKLDEECFYGFFGKLTAPDSKSPYIRNLTIIYKPFKPYVPIVIDDGAMFFGDETYINNISSNNIITIDNNSVDYNSFGFFAGSCTGYSITNCTVYILDKYSIRLFGRQGAADIRGYENIGGFIGFADNCVIDQCVTNIGHYFTLINQSAIREIYSSFCIGKLNNSVFTNSYISVGRHTNIDLFVPSGFSNTFGSMIGQVCSSIGTITEYNNNGTVKTRIPNLVQYIIVSIEHTTNIYCNNTFGSIGGLIGIVKPNITGADNFDSLTQDVTITNCLGIISNNTLYYIQEGTIGAIIGSIQPQPNQRRSPSISNCAVMYGKNTKFVGNMVASIIGVNTNRLPFKISKMGVYYESYFFNGKLVNNRDIGFNIGTLNLTDSTNTDIPLTSELYSYSESGALPSSKLTSIGDSTKADIYNIIKYSYDTSSEKHLWVDYLLEFDTSYNKTQLSNAFTNLCIATYHEPRAKTIALHAIICIMRNKDILQFTSNYDTLATVISNKSFNQPITDKNNITVIIPQDHIYTLDYNKDYFFLEKSISITTQHPIFGINYSYDIVSIDKYIVSSEDNNFRQNIQTVGSFIIKGADQIIGQIFLTDTEYAKPDLSYLTRPLFINYSDKINIYTDPAFVPLSRTQPPPPPSRQYYAPFYPPPNNRDIALSQYQQYQQIRPAAYGVNSANMGQNYQQPMMPIHFYPN